MSETTVIHAEWSTNHTSAPCTPDDSRLSDLVGRDLRSAVERAAEIAADLEYSGPVDITLADGRVTRIWPDEITTDEEGEE